jgi:hypothetical protein
VDFLKDIKPIFARACYRCHGPEKQRSDFRLDRRADAFKGGSMGSPILPHKALASPLLRFVAGLDKDVQMPPAGERLSAREIGLIRAWIDQGAFWPDDERPVVKGELWWSLRPLTWPRVPPSTGPGLPVRNPIDAFIRAKQYEKGLTASPEADRRTLIRRVTFDLTGLPPTLDEVERFVKDTHPLAYDRLVDRLLASPQHGERWARHWLDVVHYGETHGYDKDKPRPNAWPYRDYVIRAFNTDMPYSRFVQEQVAGDVLFPGSVDGVEALGFLAAGPWDLIGHTEVPEDRIDGKITRHLDRDDMVSSTIATFNSMTVHCAQCHDHKFDPISQEDYYSLQAVFAAIDRADKPYDADPVVAKQRRVLQERLQDLEAKLKIAGDRIAKLAGPALAHVDQEIAALSMDPARRPEFGYHSALARDMEQTKWVQIDLGKKVVVERINYVGCHDDFANIGAGFGFPQRFKIELADDAEFRTHLMTILDHTDCDVVNPGTAPQTVRVGGKAGQFIRFTATRLAPRQGDFMFALAELSVIDTTGTNVALGKPVSALDSIEAPPRWAKKNLVDGITPSAKTQSNTNELARLRAERQALVRRVIPQEVQQELEQAHRARQEMMKQIAELPAPHLVYAGTVYRGEGAFRGTGASNGRPRSVSILRRGDVTRPGKEVGPGALRAVSGLSARFNLPVHHGEGDRRAALARWLTHPNNVLTWRSIVNRVWNYHMGRGLANSLNDFGKMGQEPTHPELLDWLACEFLENGQSLKHLHRQIVLSACYRQSSADNPALARLDSGNQYYWRANRRKLEAEAVRDSILWVSGKLNLQMGGPSFQDFVIERPEHSPHYLYHLHEPDNPRSQRRSVYRFVVRSQQQPFLSVLDGADPSISVDRRSQTITPQQALALLNNPLTVVMARHFASRVADREHDPAAQVRLAFGLALGRPPNTQEQQILTEHARVYGLASMCRVLFNLSEFIFVD